MEEEAAGAEEGPAPPAAAAPSPTSPKRASADRPATKGASQSSSLFRRFNGFPLLTIFFLVIFFFLNCDMRVLNVGFDMLEKK